MEIIVYRSIVDGLLPYTREPAFPLRRRSALVMIQSTHQLSRDAPINHSESVRSLLLGQYRASSLEGSDELPREPFFEGLSLTILARFDDPFDGVPRALLLTERDGTSYDLPAVGVRHAAYGRSCEEDGLAHDIEGRCAGEGMHPQEHTRDNAGRALALSVAHYCVCHELEKGVLGWRDVQRGWRRCGCGGR
jgi:hypothetical protein